METVQNTRPIEFKEEMDSHAVCIVYTTTHLLVYIKINDLQ